MKAEVGFQRQVMKVMGSLDAVVSAAMTSSSGKINSNNDDEDEEDEEDKEEGEKMMI